MNNPDNEYNCPMERVKCFLDTNVQGQLSGGIGGNGLLAEPPPFIEKV
jgi:hypothetical protein